MASRFSVLLVVLIGLVGCVSHPTPPVGNVLEAENWAFRGKLGVRARQESANLGIQWQQRGERFDIDLSGPLGLSVARIYGDAHSATLETSEGRTLTAPDANRLLTRALGYSIPVTPMQYWVRGIPAPDRPFRRTEDGLHQSGWRISWGEWQQGRPVKMTFEIPRATLRLVVREWRTDI